MNRLALVALILCAPGVAAASVTHEGTWPVELKHVSFDAAHITRTDAVMRVAKEAGWSVVLRDVPDDELTGIHMTDQPADKVLDAVLGDGDFVAKRDGTLITITGAPKAPPVPSASVSAVPPPPPTAIVAAPMATTRGEDRVVRGGDVVVGEGETVHDVTVFGGNLSMRGIATGNVTVLGGNARVQKGAHVLGSATAMGGSIDVEDGAQVDGDVNVLGGSLDRHKGAKVGGTVRKNDEAYVGAGSTSSKSPSLLREVSDATTRAAMLFVFGAVLFALMGQRMNTLRIEAASRPMRSFALGLVGGIIGLASIALIGVTVIGLPVAAVLALGAVFAAYAGICAVLATVGKALVGHKTDNPHIHLLVGCALFLASGAIPFVNGLVTLAVVLTGIGIVVATRAAGTLAPNHGSVGFASAGPYRT